MQKFASRHANQFINDKNGRNLFVFDWGSLEDWQQITLIESRLLALAEQLGTGAKALGAVFSTELVPFALVGVGEDLEPDELLEFDAQCDGVLLADASGKVVLCAEPTVADTSDYAQSVDRRSHCLNESRTQ